MNNFLKDMENSRNCDLDEQKTRSLISFLLANKDQFTEHLRQGGKRYIRKIFNIEPCDSSMLCLTVSIKIHYHYKYGNGNNKKKEYYPISLAIDWASNYKLIAFTKGISYE